MLVYKIENRSRAGQFRKAGVFHSQWSRAGKIWDTIGKLRSMITSVINIGRSDQFSEWEIVEYEMVERARYRVDEIVSHDKLIKILER